MKNMGGWSGFGPQNFQNLIFSYLTSYKLEIKSSKIPWRNANKALDEFNKFAKFYENLPKYRRVILGPNPDPPPPHFFIVSTSLHIHHKLPISPTLQTFRINRKKNRNYWGTLETPFVKLPKKNILHTFVYWDNHSSHFILVQLNRSKSLYPETVLDTQSSRARTNVLRSK